MVRIRGHSDLCLPLEVLCVTKMRVNVVFLHELILSDDVQTCRPLLFAS